MKQNCDYHLVFTPEVLKELFPETLTNQFFDALLGDSTEGAYDIHLVFSGAQKSQLSFELQLHQRPGKCLACNLTYGLPTVFSRHPILDIKGLVAKIGSKLNGSASIGEWSLGRTKQISKTLHVIPLHIQIDQLDGTQNEMPN